MTAREALDQAVRQRQATKAADDEARAQLEIAIREAHRAGLAHTEIATMTGLHRNSIGRIVGDLPRD